VLNDGYNIVSLITNRLMGRDGVVQRGRGGKGLCSAGDEELVDNSVDPFEGLGPNYIFPRYGASSLRDHSGKSFSLTCRFSLEINFGIGFDGNLDFIPSFNGLTRTKDPSLAKGEGIMQFFFIGSSIFPKGQSGGATLKSQDKSAILPFCGGRLDVIGSHHVV
jgi:hypothetical protein